MNLEMAQDREAGGGVDLCDAKTRFIKFSMPARRQ